MFYLNISIDIKLVLVLHVKLQALSHFHDIMSHDQYISVYFRVIVLLDARIILSRQSLTSRENLVYGTHCLRGRMMRPENATTGQQYKQTYAPEDWVFVVR